jgi:hypothetical protein
VRVAVVVGAARSCHIGGAIINRHIVCRTSSHLLLNPRLKSLCNSNHQMWR